MTLTQLIPSLRRSIADPLDTRKWPAHTVTSIDDVVVAGVSLDCLVDWCGTPCVHTTDTGCVIVTRVETVEIDAEGRVDVWVDAELAHCDATWQEARMIGRVSTAHAVSTHLRPASEPQRTVFLPADLRQGDLIAIPSAMIIAVRDLRRAARHPERCES
ncbi:hypothetical protein [uncultured Amnibacterium sp.]|uniref:hypothetical protein n=1 Tax=uncultured Amnibacterium sp. TaxID=1631851 RepID=UPI0035CA51C1